MDTNQELERLRFAAQAYYNFNYLGRNYHNLDHADRVWKELGPHASLAAQIAAIWHDAIYIPRGKANEQASSDALTYEWVRMNIALDIPVLHAANKLIEGTTVSNHLRTDPVESSSDLALLLDADLASLADDYEMFVNNQANIILENGGDPTRMEARVMCGNFLGAFLTCRPFIYHTDKGRNEHEYKAKDNIRRYIDTKGGNEDTNN